MSPLFATKPIASLIADAHTAGVMKRSLGAAQLVLLGIGGIIGSGIFVISGTAAAFHAGPAVVLSFLLAGIAATLAALCYAEMASTIPVAGSAYTYSYATLGELVAWIIGWDLMLEYLVGAATVSVGWSGYVTTFIGSISGLQLPEKWISSPVRWDAISDSFVATGAYFNLPAVMITLFVTAILIYGIHESAKINAAVVFLKLFVLIAFAAAALPAVNPHNWVPFIPPNTGHFGAFGVSGVVQGASVVFFAYIGFDSVSTVAQECRRPDRDMPIGIVGSLAISTALYIVVSLLLTGVVSYTSLRVPNPIDIGVRAIGLHWLQVVVDIGAIAGLTSVLLVTLMGQPRIFMAMGRDGLLPGWAAQLHPTRRTPHIATAISGAICAVIGGLFPIGILSELTSIGTLFAFVLVSCGVMVLRLHQPALNRPFKVPFGPYVIPLLGAAASLALMASASAATLIRLVAWMAIGLMVYGMFGRRHSRLRAAAQNPPD